MKPEPKRITTWWIRFGDLNWPRPEGRDLIRRRAEKAAAANATTAMIFGAHFRWDYLPYFELLHDYIAAVAEELHSLGLELWDHHSVNLVHRYDTREEMRHVMLHSGPHLPLSPSRAAAASWEYEGKRLNDWRMTDVRTGEPLRYPQYAGEGFCVRNPDFLDAYLSYVKKLIRDTGIDGLSADDPIHYMHFASCGCPHCRAELKRRTGLDLPPVTDLSFWGNWDNPAWQEWIDLRYEATGSFFRRLSAAVPPGFEILSCGADSAAPNAVAAASDGRRFLEGCTRVNIEMSGNTPPCRDPLTNNTPVASRYVTSSLHRSAAQETGARCFSTGFAFSESTADIIWALNKALDSDCWLITLKPRLGLPDRILDTLPDEDDIIGPAYTFEKKHPELFGGEPAGRTAVYYSYTARDRSLYGSLLKGYYADFRAVMTGLFAAGACPVTVTKAPDPRVCPVLLLPGAAVLSEEEQAALAGYLAAGGKIVASAPCALPDCPSGPALPNAAGAGPETFFRRSEDGIHLLQAPWIRREIPRPSGGTLTEIRPGLFFHSGKASDPAVCAEMLETARRFAPPLPVQILSADGYYVTMYQNQGGLTAHLLAVEYDTVLDEELEKLRGHRSRVNLITRAVPKGIGRTVRFRASSRPEVFLPFRDEAPVLREDRETFTLELPENCFYILLRFPLSAGPSA